MELEVIEPKNQLAVLVEKSELDATKAKVLLDNFSDYFDIAAEWELKAKTIVVTDVTQKDDMKMARTGRLILRGKRTKIENTRKEMKANALREGKAIDGIANVLKALIVPIEEYLDEQEHFAENAAKAEVARVQAEMEAKAEAERIAKEKAEREEQERIRVENARLKAEAEKAEAERLRKEQELEAERKRVSDEAAAKEREIEKERAAVEAARIEAERKAQAEKQAIEDAARKEREAAAVEAKRIADEAAAKQAEITRLAAEQAAKLQSEIDAKNKAEADRLAREIECPHCHKRFIP